MRFGGHETFYLREGWLYKGLELLIESPQLLIDEFSFDYLGVGKNMAKSILHWLQATGLAERGDMAEGRKTKLLEATSLAKAIWRFDKYFTQLDTWWILHVNLLHNREHAESWYWLFNEFTADRFDRETCLRRLMRYVEQDLPGNTPQHRTVERDLGCLLNTYAIEVPAKVVDPEEDIWCPLRDLDLMVHFRSSGHTQIHRRRRNLSASVLLYALERCLQLATPDVGQEKVDRVEDIRFFDLSRLPNNPMRVFCLPTEAFFESLMEIEKTHPELGLRVVGLAGDRQIRIPRLPVEHWVTLTFRERMVAL